MEEVLVMIDMNHFRLFRPMISQILPLLIIIFSIALIPSHSQTATTEVLGPVCDYDATNSTYTCVCDEEQECYHQNIVCENDADCTVECTGKKSCDGANILCPDNGDCTVECGGQTSCARSTIACADSTNCAVQCTSTAACYGADILWPSTPTGTIVCSGGRQSCYNTNFPIPPPDEDFSLNCDKEAECSYAEIYCPEFANCDITCSARFACRFAYIHWSPNDVQSTLSCTYGDRECEGLNLPPTSSPTMEPTVEPTIQSASPTVSTTSPTTVPTVQSVAPSGHPSTTPTKHPSISPTTPSSSPTEYPSKTPTETPTISTNDPSVTPTKHPSISPTTPSSSPSKYPSKTPTETPIRPPSDNPSLRPTVSPTAPTNDPSSAPTTSPTTSSPTKSPTTSTGSPTKTPTQNPIPTGFPVCTYNATNSTYICVCDDKTECQGKTIVCANGADCRVECSGVESCKQATIICPTDSDCTVKCSSNLACQSASITCGNGDNCSVECVSSATCYNTNIQWPSTPTGTIVCGDNRQSCHGINFPMPAPYEDFTLNCDQENQCANSYIYCPEYANCHITCSAYRSCWNAYLHWSPNDVQSTLDCTTDACEGVNLPPTGSPTMQPTAAPTIQSVSPTESPTSTTTAPTAQSAAPSVNPSITPTKHPSNSPTIQSSSPTKYPSTAPTSPTSSPTKSPSVPSIAPTTASTVLSSAPSTHPSLALTGGPSRTPTSPSATPTESPTIIPTGYPTTIPTGYPSAIPTETPSKHPSVAPTQNPILSTLTDHNSTWRWIETTVISTTIDPTDPLSDNTSPQASSSIPWQGIAISFACVNAIAILFVIIYKCYARYKKQQLRKLHVELAVAPSSDDRVTIDEYWADINTPNTDTNEPGSPLGFQPGSPRPSSPIHKGSEGMTLRPLQLEDTITATGVTGHSSRTSLFDIQLSTPKGGYATDSRANRHAFGVQYWLANVVELPQYYAIFMNNGYDSLQIVKEIKDVSELIEIGIAASGHQTKLLKAIAELMDELADGGYRESIEAVDVLIMSQEGK